MKKKQQIKKIRMLMLAAVTALLFLSGCGSKAVFYAPLNNNPPVTAGRIAVIAGDADDAGKNLALAVTAELKSRTKFQVLSQDEITKKLRKYPFNINVAILEGGVPSSWLPTKDQKIVNRLQAKLKVDYVLVLWNRNMNKHVYHSGNASSVYYSMSVFGNLLKYPGGKAVGYSDFSYQRKVRFWEFKRSSYFIDSLIKNSAKGIVDEFIRINQTVK